ncbi:MAG: NADPH-dependent FMN reductase [Solimonas sp.]
MSILVLSGSLRSDSLHGKLARLAADELSTRGIDATLLSLADYPLPIYDDSIEKRDGIPDGASALRRLFARHHGFVLANPEYNGSVTPLLKNTLDWISRKNPETAGLQPFANKLALIVATSPGTGGGLRAAKHLRDILNSLGAFVLPRQVTIPNSAQSFDEAGQLLNPRHREQLSAELGALIAISGKLAA